MARPMKRANRTGSITKVKERRRNPYRVIITIGWDNNGKQIKKTLGYYHTSDEATIALANYNANPYDISGDKATFSDVYEKWSEQKYPTISQSNIKAMKPPINAVRFFITKHSRTLALTICNM